MARMKILWLIVVFLLVAICEGGSRIPPIYEPSENNDDYYIYAGNDTSSDNVTVTDAPEIPDVNITTLYTTDAPPTENVTTDVNITTFYTTDAPPPENVTTDINITTLYPTDAPPTENVTTDVNITTLYTTDAPPPENIGDLGYLSGFVIYDRLSSPINAYLRVPYAKPPVDELRFKDPEPATTLGERNDPRIDMPYCVQYSDDTIIGQEDCLYLNIYVPNHCIKKLGELGSHRAQDKTAGANPSVWEVFTQPLPCITSKMSRSFIMHANVTAFHGISSILILALAFPVHRDCESRQTPTNFLHLCITSLPTYKDLKEVSTANDSTAKPVMVFLHGNTFDQGSGRLDQFDPRFLLTKDVILVTVNFRLGIFGFFHLEDEELGTPGNAALKDQRLALAWVKEHIHNFGGDENNICIFGQSAGAASVHFHMLSPRSEGLFHKAIIQSGTALSPWVLGTENNGNKLADKLEETPENNEELLSILRGKEAYEILAAARTIADELRAFESPWSQFTGPIIESHGNEEVAFLADAPFTIIESGEYNAVPMLLGFTNAEGVGIETMLRRVNDGWEGLIKDFFNLIPSELGLKRDSSAAIDLARRIEEFYFDGDQPEEGNVEALVRLFGDIFFAFPALRTALEHYRTSDEPIYLYKFSLDTDLNVFGWRDEATANIAGASHGDDLGYLFYIQNLTPSSLGPVEIAALENVVETWTRFARTGSPSIQIEEQPEEPEDQPEEPENQPEEPEDQPEVPENQPEGPEDQPVVPEAPPPQPDGPPEAPGTQGDGQVQPNVKENQLTQLDQPDDADDSESIGQWLPFTEEHPYFADIQQNGTIPSINPSEESMAFWEEVYNEFFRDNGGTASLQSISIVMVLCVVATQILLKYY
ncbi:hypothetical protein Trydic_g15492 [Trypoxylus dichotomus]